MRVDTPSSRRDLRRRRYGAATGQTQSRAERDRPVFQGSLSVRFGRDSSQRARANLVPPHRKWPATAKAKLARSHNNRVRARCFYAVHRAKLAPAAKNANMYLRVAFRLFRDISFYALWVGGSRDHYVRSEAEHVGVHARQGSVRRGCGFRAGHWEGENLGERAN
jgi:hypothetical protein